jgi:hypothetical protein
MESNKRPPGRPRTETYINPMWKEIILEHGRRGSHVTAFLQELGLSWDQHYAMLKRNKDYNHVFQIYQRDCEQWWYQQAHKAVESGESNKFNQRLWTIIMKNKFRDNWSDEKQIDITTQGDKINPADNKIQVEIIRKNIESEE